MRRRRAEEVGLLEAREHRPRDRIVHELQLRAVLRRVPGAGHGRLDLARSERQSRQDALERMRRPVVRNEGGGHVGTVERHGDRAERHRFGDDDAHPRGSAADVSRRAGQHLERESTVDARRWSRRIGASGCGRGRDDRGDEDGKDTDWTAHRLLPRFCCALPKSKTPSHNRRVFRPAARSAPDRTSRRRSNESRGRQRASPPPPARHAARGSRP